MGSALLGTSAAAALVGLSAYAVRGRSSAVFGPSQWHGDRSRPTVALTFDDGPSESTPELLEILAKYGVPTTFFMCGQNVDRLPQVAREVVSAGHEIGNHSDTHPRFDFCSADFMFQEMNAAQQKIQRHTGVTPRWFRAPYGVRWFGMGAAQQRAQLDGVMWSILGLDWKWPAAKIADLVAGQAGNGDIICLHDGRLTRSNPDVRATLGAVREFVPRLVDLGLQFQTVSDLLIQQP